MVVKAGRKIRFNNKKKRDRGQIWLKEGEWILAIRSLLGNWRSGVEWRISDFDTQDCATVMTFGDDDICHLQVRGGLEIEL